MALVDISTHQIPVPSPSARPQRGMCSRHTTVHATAVKRLPAYATLLAASLAKSAASVLGGGIDSGSDNIGGGRSVAGSLAVAAASLRFVLTVVVAASEVAETAPALRFEDASSSPGGSTSPEGKMSRSQGGAQHLRGLQQQQQHEQQQQSQPQPQPQQQQHRGEQFGGLLEVLWASRCLEVCVHTIGEGARCETSGGR